jgi:hypothetical protein
MTHTTTTRGPRLPLYKRKRRRIYLDATLAILGLVLDACLRGLLLLADPSRRG